MAQNLTTERQVDSHLKPVKSGDELSSLELSTKSNGARITGDLEVTGEVSAGSFSNSEFYHIINVGYYEAPNGTLSYLPLNGYILEQTSVSSRNEYLSFVLPFDGYLDFVIMRSENACGSSVVGLHLSSEGTEVPNSTASATVTIDMAVDDTAYKFNFTSSNTFTAGQILAISFDPTAAAYDINATIVFRFYGNKPLGDSEA